MTNETYTPDDRAATKPLVDAACKWCEAESLLFGSYQDAAATVFAAEVALLIQCRKLYEASKTKGEEE